MCLTPILTLFMKQATKRKATGGIKRISLYKEFSRFLKKQKSPMAINKIVIIGSLKKYG